MKKIKRLVIFLCVISCMTMLCSCGNKSKIKAGFNYDKDELVSTTVSYIYAFDQAIKNDKNKSAGTSSENAQLTTDYLKEYFEGQYPEKKVAKPYISAMDEFKEQLDENGEFLWFDTKSDDDAGKIESVDISTMDMKDVEYSITEDSTSVTLTINTHFEKRDVEVVATYEYDSNYGIRMTSMAYNPAFTKSEIMVKAALNTLLGIGTVFAVLILLSLIIGLFKYVSNIESFFKKKAEKKKNKTSAKTADKTTDSGKQTGETNTDTSDEGELSDDEELVAVIAAAVAAYEGTTSTDRFVVRSIKRVQGKKKW